jgi:hypothetical protein
MKNFLEDNKKAKDYLTEMPHYDVGTHEIEHSLDLELETATKAEEVIERLSILASGGKFKSKNQGGYFSIPDKRERIEFIKLLSKDSMFELILQSRFNLDANEVLQQMKDLVKKSR